MTTSFAHSFAKLPSPEKYKNVEVLKGWSWIDFKGIVHQKKKILSSFTYPQGIPNLYECICSAEHKGRYFEESL